MNVQRSRLWRALAAVMAVLMLLAFGHVAAAPAPPPSLSLPPALDPANVAGADDGTLDVGAEAQGDAPPLGPGGSDLPAANGAAWNFYSQMRNAGYTGAHDFYYTNQNSWEIDFKRAALGGIENSMIDNVDIGYYHDHGNGGVGEWFPWGHNDNWLVPNDCLDSYGTQDLEWLAIGGCSTFSDALRQGWASCLNGAHLLLGYKTTAYDGNWGGIWADQMLGWQWLGIWFRQPKTVTQAWFTQCDQTQPSGVVARVIAEHNLHFNDKVWGRGGPAYGDIVDNTYWWLDHSCYKAPPRPIDASILAVLAEVPSYQVLDRQVSASYVQGVAGALGLEGQVQLSPDGTQFALTDSTGTVSGTLSVEVASGGYLFQNLAQLWVPPEGPLSLPDPGSAVQLGNSFLNAANPQALPGVQYADMATAHAETETFTEALRPNRGAQGVQPDSILQSASADVLVAYGRTLTPVAAMMGGEMMAVEVSVVGPGSTTKLYYGGQGGVGGQSVTALSPIGLTGGSRDVQAQLAKPVTIMTAATAWDEFLADKKLAVVTVPLDADQIIRKGETFSYYEQPAGVAQEEFIPVWVFTADFLREGQIIAADVLVYVPASADYYPPAVTIDSPAASAQILAGRRIELNGTATGGFQPFTYEWSSSTEGVLGSSEDILTGLNAPAKPGGAATPTTLTLKVTNANGQSRTAEVIVDVIGQLTYLPMIVK